MQLMKNKKPRMWINLTPFLRKSHTIRKNMVAHPDSNIYKQWQSNWNQYKANSDSLTKLLIFEVPKDRGALFPQNISFAQAISGMGFFGSFLGKISKRAILMCREEERPKHVFWHCWLNKKNAPVKLDGTVPHQYFEDCMVPRRNCAILVHMAEKGQTGPRG